MKLEFSGAAPEIRVTDTASETGDSGNYIYPGRRNVSSSETLGTKKRDSLLTRNVVKGH